MVKDVCQDVAPEVISKQLAGQRELIKATKYHLDQLFRTEENAHRSIVTEPIGAITPIELLPNLEVLMKVMIP